MSTATGPTTAAEHLFTPFKVGSLALENRIVMAPMSRDLSPGGVPGADVARYYARRAEHGVGLIITEGTFVGHHAAGNRPSVPRFHGADALAGWAEVARAVHGAGGRIVPQLWHVGQDPLLWGRSLEEARRTAPKGVELFEPPGGLLSPSGVDPSGMDPDGLPARAMSESDIADVIDAFGRAAADARRIGFDGIELHAAHGYLFDQFFWNVTNRRTDRYGGDLAGRIRFCAEVVRACRAEAGPGFPVILRISQWKVAHYTARIADGPKELEALLTPLVEAGVDVFHCSTRRFWRPEFEGSPLNLAGWVKKVTGQPTITVGSVGLKDSDYLGYVEGKGAETADIELVAERLAQGEFDLVAVGRALVANPAWAESVRSGRTHELRDFDAAMLNTLD
ncbi:NADH:flavin oxidoreductase [Streptomyces sp. 351MFTsu5.1]|uniref:NADH:flavin oxidoreductase n=1 Tax=Streptomyces sp. 351MFTsu5.1 TaxID=1172180 RepID=UPI00037EF158|nr:NADH:flavin oxidoreductase [Streptomyces sp. 351MFTsu5.1]